MGGGPASLTAEVWATGGIKDADGRIVNPTAFYNALYNGSCAPELRKLVWKTLLGQYPLSFSDAERSTRDAEVKLAFEARQKELVRAKCIHRSAKVDAEKEIACEGERVSARVCERKRACVCERERACI